MPETGQFVDPKILERILLDKKRREACRSGVEQKGPEKKDLGRYAESLRDTMRRISGEVNKEAEEKHGLANLLNPDSSLNMNGYADGPYTKERVQKDNDWVREREYEFSSANDPRVLANYGNISSEERVRRWKQEKEKNLSGLTEMAITALLYKFLHKDGFFIARASSYDDYNKKEAAVDNILIDPETGGALCAFDEVSEVGTGESTAKKIAKIRQVISKGGANVRYGLQMDKKEGKLKRAPMSNVPVFYLALTNDELKNLLGNMDFNPNGVPTQTEEQIFSKLIASLREQKKILDNTAVSSAVKEKLRNMDNLLNNLMLHGPAKAA